MTSGAGTEHVCREFLLTRVWENMRRILRKNSQECIMCYDSSWGLEIEWSIRDLFARAITLILDCMR